LALLHKAKNEYGSALAEYEEALQIRRNLAAENPSTYLPYVAMALLNLSIFYLQAQPNQEQSIVLAMEVIQIALQFPEVPVVQQYAGTALQVLQANGFDFD
jgi:hypothetical protein